ncbi:MAG: hypothetical protein N3A58_05345 [Spirochaetes bacterium]|nr:hypothetical protein [Spirochaetota bacterium]
MVFKNSIIFESEVEEILNFDDKLTFILKNSQFIPMKMSNFSDIGYIDKYKIEKVIYFGGNKLHISNSNYYDFIPSDLIEKRLICKIDLKKRILISKLNKFFESFENEFNKYFYKINYNFFFTEYCGYIILDFCDRKYEKDIFQIFYNLKEKFLYNFNICSYFYFNERFYVYFIFETLFLNYYSFNLNNVNFLKINNRNIYYGFFFEDIYKRLFYDLWLNNYDFIFLVLDKGYSYIAISKNLYNERFLNEYMIDKNLNINKNENCVFISYDKNQITNVNSLIYIIEIYCNLFKLVGNKT